MSEITYYVVQPFEHSERGLIVRQAREVHGGPDAARALARRLSAKGGAIAFSRTGNPSAGEFADAELLGVFGDVPEDAADLAAAAAG